MTKKKNTDLSAQTMSLSPTEMDVGIANLIWSDASTNYQTRIPLATRTNITAVGNAILTYASAKNEFLDALINKISLTMISNKMATNRLAAFKKGSIEYGGDIEEVFTDIQNAQHFDVAVAEAEVFKRVKPDVSAIFHRVNREDFYKVTIEDAQIKRAFMDAGGLGKLVYLLACVFNTQNINFENQIVVVYDF
jgi:hypothetical protein